jgi:protein phosphatase
MIDLSRFDGIRAIGDIHGEVQSFQAAIARARADRRFLIQLGDLVDRGPDSAGALHIALDLVDGGDGLFLRGNHDDKLYRALKGNPVRLTIELARTLGQVQRSPGLAARFVAGFAEAPWWLRFDNHLLVHAAFHPAMLAAASPNEVHPRRTSDACRWLALYGEGRIDDGETLPTRTYGWIDTVPAGLTVIIGHDAVSREAVTERRSPAGGRILFCDTGCGKGGRLSHLDVDSTGGGEPFDRSHQRNCTAV